MNLVNIQKAVYSVVSAANKKKVLQAFHKKEDAKVYRNELNAGTGYENEDSGRGMPFIVVNGVQHPRNGDK
jgi:cystathionine beta-lyase family protein involved in aluminum resistance